MNMPKIIYNKTDAEIKDSIIIFSDESADHVTSTDDKSDSISVELGIISPTADIDSWKVKESNTVYSST